MEGEEHMTTATKKPAATPAAPVSIQDAAAKRMQERITAYRKAVEDAAAGKSMSAETVEAVLEHLDAMGLPDFAWQRDVEAVRQMGRLAVEVEAFDAERPGRAQRIAKLLEEIKRCEQSLKDARAEHYNLTHTAEMQYVDRLRRQNELVAGHPHVFATVENAAAMRLAEKAKGRNTTAAEVTGWSR
jgi:predicted  nucleic acid-binding Zn-ribbon protein